MSEWNDPKQMPRERHEDESSVEFVLRAAWFAAEQNGVCMSPAEVVQTLRDCLCVDAPEELRARIIAHVRSHMHGGGDVRRD